MKDLESLRDVRYLIILGGGGLATMIYSVNSSGKLLFQCNELWKIAFNTLLGREIYETFKVC